MVQGIRSINGRYKIDRGRLRIAWEMGKPKNLCVLLGTVLLVSETVTPHG